MRQITNSITQTSSAATSTVAFKTSRRCFCVPLRACIQPPKKASISAPHQRLLVAAYTDCAVFMPRASRCGKIYAEICGTRNAFSLGQISQTYAFQTGVSEKQNENTRHRCRRTNSSPKRVENATGVDG